MRDFQQVAFQIAYYRMELPEYMVWTLVTAR